MIEQLEINNFILIENSILTFDKQINVLTGDTGSGKSVIINSIRFLSGMRMSSKLFFDKQKAIKVTARLRANEQLLKQLAMIDIEARDNIVEVMRKVTPSGKNIVRINGELVSVGELTEIFEPLLTIYSQYSVAKFKTENSYLQIVDHVAGNAKVKAEYQQAYKIYTQMQVEIADLKRKSLLADERLELIEMRMKDLAFVDSQTDIDELIAEKQKLEERMENYKQSAQASEQIANVSNSLNELLQSAISQEHLNLLNEALINVDEVSFEIAKESEPVDEQYLAQISEYISSCRRVCRKYNIEISAVNEYRQQLEEERSGLDAIDSDIANSQAKLEKQYEQVIRFGQKLTKTRQAITSRLMSEVTATMQKLSLVNSKFKIEINNCQPHRDGIDQVIFKVQMNAGSEFTAIHQTASGGEIARFLLALEASISAQTKGGFIVFDEIDTGVSGHVGIEMAAVMQQIAKHHRLLIVTHLAQVAAISENHYTISKANVNGQTISSSQLLTEDEKPLALAKMISGAEMTDNAIEHAKQLLIEINK